MRHFITFIFILMFTHNTQAQFENFGKKLGEKLKRRTERKVDETVDKSLDKAEDGLEDAAKGDKKDSNSKNTSDKTSSTEPSVNKNGDQSEMARETAFYTKFDFVSGDDIIFYDDYSRDNLGDFPAKWNTNGSGEIAADNTGSLFFKVANKSLYIPTTKKALPENFTCEFDMVTNGLHGQVSSVAKIYFLVDDNSGLNPGKTFSSIEVSFCQYTPIGIKIKKIVQGSEVFSNTVGTDTRELVKNARISMAVNKRRFRLWMNEQKVVDMPTLVTEGPHYLKIGLDGFVNDFNGVDVYLGNIKIAASGEDLRSKLLAEGRVSSNGIYFDTGSDHLRPESFGVIREIAQVLQQEEGLKINIVGHTDSDGDNNSNLELSKRRAEAVKQALNKEFNIKSSRLEVDGKGEEEPIATNDSPEGKAANRRVEFIKM